MFATNVNVEVVSIVASERTVGAAELRQFAALVVLVPQQRIWPAVSFSTFRADTTTCNITVHSYHVPDQYREITTHFTAISLESTSAVVS